MYRWDNTSILRGERNAWYDNFQNQIKPKLIEINEKVENKEIIALTLMGFRAMGVASNAFKIHMENEFYSLIKKKQISPLHFNVIQGIALKEKLDSGKKTMKDIENKAQKLSTMLYRNAIENIAGNNPDSTIAKNSRQGVIFRSKYPFGTINIDNIEKSL